MSEYLREESMWQIRILLAVLGLDLAPVLLTTNHSQQASSASEYLECKETKIESQLCAGDTITNDKVYPVATILRREEDFAYGHAFPAGRWNE